MNNRQAGMLNPEIVLSRTEVKFFGKDNIFRGLEASNDETIQT